MRKLLLLCLAVVCAVSGQTASYPSAVATDQNLKVTVNGVTTALRAKASPGDTVLTVADCSRIVPNMLLTLSKKEIVNVVAVSGSGCNITVNRGFDGTTAVSHSSGAEVAGYPTAWERNSLKSEIVAIESTLGANLSNIIAGNATFTVTKFQFTRSPGGSLTPGANAITFSTGDVPLGINGSDSGHYVYISGGTGTAENCLISGGSAVSGGSGTLFITCSNSHSGGWTMTSSTAGYDEARRCLPFHPLYASLHVGTILFPDGDFTMHQGIASGLDMVSIVGQSRGGTKLNFDAGISVPAITLTSNSGDALTQRTRLQVRDMTIVVASTSQDGIVVNGVTDTPNLVTNVIINGGRRALWVYGTGVSSFTHLRLSGYQTHCIYADVTLNGDNLFDDIECTTPAASTADAVYVVDTGSDAGIIAYTAYLTNITVFALHRYGFFIENSHGVQKSVFVLGNHIVADGAFTGAGLYVHSAMNVKLTNGWFVNSGGNYGGILDNAGQFMCSACEFYGAISGDLRAQNISTDIQLTGSRFFGPVRAFNLDNTAHARWVLSGNIKNPASAWVDGSQFVPFLNATQSPTLTSPQQWFFGNSLNDLTFSNREAGATTPDKYLRVDSSGCVSWLNSAHNAVIYKLCDDGKVTQKTTTFSGLGSASAAGVAAEWYCTDCTTAATCAGSGSGHKAVSNGTAWTCQ